MLVPDSLISIVEIWPALLAAGAAYLGVRIGLSRHEILIADHDRRITSVEVLAKFAHERISKIFEDEYNRAAELRDKR